jgi:hypothetical protein
MGGGISSSGTLIGNAEGLLIHSSGKCTIKRVPEYGLPLELYKK